MRLETGKIRFSNLNGAPVERNIYNFRDSDGELRDEIEEAFSYTEVHGSRIIAKFCQTLDPTPEDRFRFGAFVANMIIRTKSFRDTMPAILSNGFGIKEVALNHLQLYPLLYMIKLGQIITHMKWHIVKAGLDELFITSDNPVAIGQWLTPDHMQFGGALLDPKAFLTFPVTRDLCFVADWQGKDCDYLPPLDGFVTLANRKRMSFAYDHLFSHAPELIDIAEVTRVRSELPAIVAPLGTELSLVPPDTFALPELRPITENLFQGLREAGLPTKPL
jgi:hypothetical protein